MAVTQPPTAPAAPGVAGAAPSRAAAPSRQGTVLVAALVAACLYAAFAHGAAGFPEETWLQAGLAAVALAATAAWAGQRGIAARASAPAVYGVVALTAFAAWCGLSELWSVTPDRSWLELNRGLAYVLVVGLGIAAGDERAAGARARRAGLARRERRGRALRPRRQGAAGPARGRA